MELLMTLARQGELVPTSLSFLGILSGCFPPSIGKTARLWLYKTH
jgi:hypothetical protein